ncbi:MAG TPA: hypothetical protein VHH55_00850 [Gaiellaceae bacterium]|jgi:hypothetical protein|nr:hypothetical protein [Gaiellaceae bacterium]
MSLRDPKGRRRMAGFVGFSAVLALAIAIVAVPAAAHKGKGKPHHAGFKTSQASMLDPAVPGAKATPLITVGETLPGTNYKFESIPDGIALWKGHGWKVHAYVNHETSTVPFPFTPGTPPAMGTGFNDFTNALLSKLTLSRHGGGILSGKYVIPSEANYQRFCSNFIASKKHGFERPLLFTNEEATDFVNRTGTAWPGTPGEQAGVVVAYDLKTKQYRSVYGMGRHNHENSVALEKYGYPVVLSGDDTFSAPASQMYMYLADDADAVWNDQGTLWAFRSSNPAINDYGDLTGSMSVAGEFIRVPTDIAKGDQTALENWSNANNVFQFIRVEDIAYDRKHKNVVYFADTGEPRALPDPVTGRLRRGPSGTMGPWPNGRMFKMVLDRKDPKIVKSLSILIDGDARGAAGAGALDLIHQPDNVETTRNLLLFQEDPGSHNQYPLGTGTTARIWAYDLKKGGAPYVVARVNQSADEGPTDVDASTSKALAGGWESSGIVDASKFFGKGAFLVDVQAGSLVIQEEVRTEGNNRLTYQREGGQLLLFRLPAKGHDHDDDDDDDHRGKGKKKGHDKKGGR